MIVRAVLLVGYGSVLPGIGTSMIRLSSRISSAGIAPIAAAGFITGCRPTFNEALESFLAAGGGADIEPSVSQRLSEAFAKRVVVVCE